MSAVRAWALDGLPEVRPGDDLAALLRDGGYEPGDVLVVAHKIVSKAEGALRALDAVTVTDRARTLAREHGKDPRHVQVILDESAAVLRAQRGVLICRTHHGFVCANAGVDVSNAPETARWCSCRATPTRAPAPCVPRCRAVPRWSSPTPSAAPGATGSATSRSASRG